MNETAAELSAAVLSFLRHRLSATLDASLSVGSRMWSVIMERFCRWAIVLIVLATLLAPASRTSAFAQSDTLTCDDFTSQDAAQIVLDEDDTYAGTLDEDGDGEACPELPARASDNDLELFIGYPRVTFEDEHSEADDLDGAEDFAIGDVYTGIDGYDSIGVYWDEDFAAHIVVQLEDELSEDDAYDAALMFLPETTDVESRAEELSGGELLYTGHDDDLEDVFDDDIYDAYEVGGEPGDVRIILVPGDEDYAVLDIAIGLGEEYAGGSGEEPSGDVDEYLASVRESTDVLLDEVDTFNDLYVNGEDLSDEDIDTLVDILFRWSTVSEESDALTAPDEYEEIQATFEDATAAFESVSEVFADGAGADTEEGLANFETAEELINEVDALLTDEGV
jgi:hypothetical protein